MFECLCCVSLLQLCRRGGARLRGPVHQLHGGATGHRRCKGLEASERTVPGPSGAHPTAPRAKLSWGAAARYRVGRDSLHAARAVCLLCVSDVFSQHDAGEPLELMFQFFVKFGDKPCCITDLKIFLDLLAPDQHVQVSVTRWNAYFSCVCVCVYMY